MRMTGVDGWQPRCGLELERRSGGASGPAKRAQTLRVESDAWNGAGGSLSS